MPGLKSLHARAVGFGRIDAGVFGMRNAAHAVLMRENSVIRQGYRFPSSAKTCKVNMTGKTWTRGGKARPVGLSSDKLSQAVRARHRTNNEDME